MSAEHFTDDLGKICDPDTGLESRARIPMAALFALAKAHVDLPIPELEKLLTRDSFPIRMGAVAIMDWKARQRHVPEQVRRDLYELYLRRHDRIDNWSMVDRAAPHVVGGYLHGRSHQPLFDLAASSRPMERRTAIVATWYFIKNGEVDTTFRLAEVLVHDTDELVQKGVGSWVREAGKRDEERLIGFLDRYAPTMPRVMLRYAIEKLPADVRRIYLKS